MVTNLNGKLDKIQEKIEEIVNPQIKHVIIVKNKGETITDEMLKPSADYHHVSVKALRSLIDEGEVNVYCFNLSRGTGL